MAGVIMLEGFQKYLGIQIRQRQK